MGRPTKYRKDMCERVNEYLETVGREQTKMPSLCGFAIFLGVNSDTIQEWGKKHKEFSVSLRKILTFQQNQLIDDGIYGGKEVNSTIVKLLLMNNHGYKERNDQTSGDKPLKGLVQVNYAKD